VPVYTGLAALGSDARTIFITKYYKMYSRTALISRVLGLISNCECCGSYYVVRSKNAYMARWSLAPAREYSCGHESARVIASRLERFSAPVSKATTTLYDDARHEYRVVARVSVRLLEKARDNERKREHFAARLTSLSIADNPL
jgi:hypothetical protein